MAAPGSDFFIKGNAGQFGFYRVNYDDEGWKDIINLMNKSHKVLQINIELNLSFAVIFNSIRSLKILRLTDT